jgi:CheY-like chemotaxis protein
MSGYRFERLKILVVDDNAHMRKLIAAILQAFGVGQIVEAASGEKAWALLREAGPDIVTLDWVMDGISGIELARRIRGHPQSPNPFVPIVMLTGYAQADHVEQARDAGINEFLAKPVSATAMMARLVSVIEQPRPFVRTECYFGPCRRRHGEEGYNGLERRKNAAPSAAA